MAEPSTAEAEALVYIVDDDPSVRAAIEDLLASVGLCVRAFGATREFLDHWQRQPPQGPACLVLDIRMPGQSGMDFRRQMLELGLKLPTIFITGHGDIPMSVRAMKAGAAEFLTKPFERDVMLQAIRVALERSQASLAHALELKALRDRYERLTRREREVFAWVVSGLLNKQVGAELGMTEATVKAHRGQVMLKMQAESLAELVRIAARLEVPLPSRVSK